MAHAGEDQEHEEHPCGADHQRPTTTVVFNDVESIEGSAKVDAVQDHLGDKGVVDTLLDCVSISPGKRF